MPTLHTERGDIVLSHSELALYNALARDRFHVRTVEELARELSVGSRQLCGLAHSLRAKCQTLGFDYAHCVWGIGYRLEARHYEQTGV